MAAPRPKRFWPLKARCHMTKASVAASSSHRAIEDAVSTVVLTGEQVRQLRQALDELAPQGEVRGEEQLRLVA